MADCGMNKSMAKNHLASFVFVLWKGSGVVSPTTATRQAPGLPTQRLHRELGTIICAVENPFCPRRTHRPA